MKRFQYGFLVLAVSVSSLVWAAEDIVKQPDHWAHEYTHRAPDPDVVFGTLPNGMRYAIRHNELPKDGVAMRLRIGSGSLQEHDDELGLAHFIEHMAFRGSKQLADGDVVKMLERQGLKLGPDTNAFTSFEETVYMFNFPKASPDAINTGLTLFREIGENLTFDAKLLDVERNVVLSEERLRDSPQYRMTKANYGNALAGTLVPKRWTIGTIESLKSATRNQLERYYQSNYRPNNATLVIVGNVDVKQLEKDIQAKFSDWKSAAVKEPTPVQIPQPTKPVAEYFEKGVEEGVSISWVRPVDRRAQTLARDKSDLTRILANLILSLRLSDRASKPGSPFVNASINEINDIFGIAGMSLLNITTPPEKLAPSLNAVLEEQKIFQAKGVTEQELKRAATILKTELQQAAASANTRQSIALADEVVRAVDQDEIVLSPKQTLDLFNNIAESLKVSDINAAIPELFSGQGPILFRSTNEKPLTETALTAMLKAAVDKPVAERTVEQAVVWPYGQFGKPGEVSSQTEDKELGATFIGFKNGVKLIVKHTDLEKDKIRVNVSFGLGRQTVDAKHLGSLWASGFMGLGGTRQLSQNDIVRYTQNAGKIMSADLEVGLDAFEMGGTTRPADLNTQVELLAAYIFQPGYRPEMTEKLNATIPPSISQIETNAGAVFYRELQKLTTGGDNRFVRVPDPIDMRATDVGHLKAALADADKGPIEITMVGDVTVDAAVKAVAYTFGAAPPMTGKQPSERIKRQNVTPSKEPTVVKHQGRADQAFYGEIWPLPDYYANPKLSDQVAVAAAVLNGRLVDLIREKMGLTYSPMVNGSVSQQLSGIGYFMAAIETPKENFTQFHAGLQEQMEALAKTEITADELERAKRPIVESRKKRYENNGFWLSVLSQLSTTPVIREDALHQVENAQAVTAEQVKAVFANYLANHPAKTLIAISESAKLN